MRKTKGGGESGVPVSRLPYAPASRHMRVSWSSSGHEHSKSALHDACEASMSAPSVCTAKHVRAYMEDGTLPEEGTVCEPDELPFVGQVSDVRAMSTEDVKLLEALRGLSEVVPMFGV